MIWDNTRTRSPCFSPPLPLLVALPDCRRPKTVSCHGCGNIPAAGGIVAQLLDYSWFFPLLTYNHIHPSTLLPYKPVPNSVLYDRNYTSSPKSGHGTCHSPRPFSSFLPLFLYTSGSRPCLDSLCLSCRLQGIFFVQQTRRAETRWMGRRCCPPSLGSYLHWRVLRDGALVARTLTS